MSFIFLFPKPDICIRVFLTFFQLQLQSSRMNTHYFLHLSADSCYYLGFIFTITSITIALTELPYLQERLADIATRFGVAMFTTVLGLAVRVVIVNFRPDVEDAARTVPDSLMDTANLFRVRLEDIVVQLGHLQDQVAAKSRKTVDDTHQFLEISLEY